jgi:hypothetical protein
MLYSIKTSGQNINFQCLDRSQKEMIVTCFEQNRQCHDDLAAAAKHDESLIDRWEFWGLGVAGGVVVGLIVGGLRH